MPLHENSLSFVKSRVDAILLMLIAERVSMGRLAKEKMAIIVLINAIMMELPYLRHLTGVEKLFE